MARNILIERLHAAPVSEQQVEIVERKGLGHPDSICDAIMERVSLALTREYLDRFGGVLHHNLDKGMLVAGKAEHRLGGGSIIEPMRLIFGDRATIEVDGQRVPVAEIAVETAKTWLRENMRFVDVERDLRYQVEIKPGSQALAEIFRDPTRAGLYGANDTSAAVGYAPLTETERLVLETEAHLNSPEFKALFPECGEDVKIMGFRARRRLHLTVAVPLIDRFIASERDYFARKERILEAIQAFVGERRGELEDVRVYLNTLDHPGHGAAGLYLSVLGTSAEDGDSGQVGRGNRVSGVVALNRPASAEAAAGKNPVSHTGKIYNVLSYKVAQEIYREVPGVREVYVWLCSQIGVPIDRPKIASAQVVLARGARFATVARHVREIVDYELAHIGEFVRDLAAGRYHVH